jgi:protein SMG6
MHTLEDNDVAADRAREKRKRKEGSEKGSLGIAAVRKRDEERSRGSRSSEGSESLKDRERGRGKR